MIQQGEPSSKLSYTLPKTERLYLRDEIERLFALGSSFIAYPLRVVYLLQDEPRMARCSIMTGAPKKRFRRAVKRNRVKRLMREAYRHHKHPLEDCLAEHKKYLMLSFGIVSSELPDYATMEAAVCKALSKIEEKVRL